MPAAVAGHHGYPACPGHAQGASPPAPAQAPRPPGASARAPRFAESLAISNHPRRRPAGTGCRAGAGADQRRPRPGGAPPYTFSTGLDNSADGHNTTMAGGCGLSHQCPGEPPLGTRETDAGVHWTSAGENIGEGGPVAAAGSAIAQMAVGLTQDMLNEKSPDDGHRLNILSSTFQHIGIAVLRSSSGTVWMTQDFSN
jgi:Cysteine-rich secretory protein family